MNRIIAGIFAGLLMLGAVSAHAQERPGEDIEIPEPKNPPKVHPSCEPIASDFGSMIGITGQQRIYDVPHSGIDLLVPNGTPIVAASHGVVVVVGHNAKSGNIVRLSHGTREWQGHTLHIFSSYVHLSSNDGVQVGEHVRRGQLIGYSGATGIGFKSIVHLHFEVQVNIDGVVEIEDGRIATAKPVNPHLFWFPKRDDKQFIGFFKEPREPQPFEFDGKFRQFTFPVPCPG